MSRPIPPEVVSQVADKVFSGNKIAAIKLYREHSGEGLKESKDFVEALEAELRSKEPGKFVARPAGKGCLGMVILCGFGLLVVLFAVFALPR